MKEIKEALADLKRTRAMEGIKASRPAILFIDEIHRFNKAQQDALLPFVEEGTVTLFGTTTENPSFEIRNALLSRCRVLSSGPFSTRTWSGSCSAPSPTTSAGSGNRRGSSPPTRFATSWRLRTGTPAWR